MRKKLTYNRLLLTILLVLLTATFLAAQNERVITQHEQGVYAVGFHPGSQYTWEVVTQFAPVVDANPNDYRFVSEPNLHEVGIVWNTPGRYYLLLTETDASGCTNAKAVSVLVLPNNRSVGFITAAGSSCYQRSGNGFELPVSALNSDGQPLEARHFPLTVEFTVNGENHSQALNYFNPILQISDEWFDTTEGQPVSVVVEIIRAADLDNVPVQVRNGNHEYAYTLSPLPQIEFARLLPDTIGWNTYFSFQALSETGISFDWWMTDASGTRTDFSSKTSSTEQRLWDTEGSYRIFVQGIGENGCRSEIISKPFVVMKMEYNLPALFAVPDYFVGYEGTSVTGNLGANDFISTGEALNLVYSLRDGPVENLMFEPDGTFIFLVPDDFSGKIRFSYNVCYEQQMGYCETAEVEIRINLSDPVGNVAPIAVTDVFFMSPDNKLIGNLLDNDLDPDGDASLLTMAIQPEVAPRHGSVQMEPYGSFVYVPDEGFTGRDQFQYIVRDAGNPALQDSGHAYVFVSNFVNQNRLPSILDDFYAIGLDKLAGSDTVIGACNPYQLNGLLKGDEGFQFLWEPAGLLDNPTSASPIFTPGISATFRLTVTDSYGLTAVDSVTVTVAELKAEAGAGISVYRNETAVLDGSASLGEGLQFRWSALNGKIDSGANTPHPVVSGFGTYYLEVTDRFGCVATDSVNVSMLSHAPVAVADFDSTSYRTELKIRVLDNDIDPDKTINPLSLAVAVPPFKGTATVNYTDFTIHYKPGDQFTGTDNFVYRICDFSNQCDQAEVTVLVTGIDFFIPEAFSPNGDNVNDYFEIKGIEWYEGNSIEIFNRWGNRVYRVDNYGINTVPKFWDGKSNTGFRIGNDGLPSGTYFYILNLGNGEKRIAGSVYLDR